MSRALELVIQSTYYAPVSQLQPPQAQVLLAASTMMSGAALQFSATSCIPADKSARKTSKEVKPIHPRSLQTAESNSDAHD